MGVWSCQRGQSSVSRSSRRLSPPGSWLFAHGRFGSGSASLVGSKFHLRKFIVFENNNITGKLYCKTLHFKVSF